MSKAKQPTNLQALEIEYRNLAPILPGFCEEFERQLSKILKDAEVTLGVPIQYRIKTWDSISEKFSRVSMSISHIQHLYDLVGFRLILLFQKDVDKVVQLIESTFVLSNKINTANRLSEDQFGYSSQHFVVGIPEQWLAIPTFSAFKGLKAEIQIRTVAQHIWAEVSHKLQYKQESNVPPSLRRSIHRVSAILELVDLEFERILAERTAYRDTTAVESSSDEELNVDLLEKILDSRFPIEHKAFNEEYAAGLADLFAFQIKTKNQLEGLIDKNIKNAIEYDEIIRAKAGMRGIGPYFNFTGLLRAVLKSEFKDKWQEYSDRHLTRRG